MSEKVRLSWRDLGEHAAAPCIVWSRGLGSFICGSRINRGGDNLAIIERYDPATNSFVELFRYSKKAGDFDNNAGDIAFAVGDDGSGMFLISAGDGRGRGEISSGHAYYAPQILGIPAADGRTPIQFTTATEDAYARSQIAALGQGAANAAIKADQAHNRANEMINLVKSEVKKAVAKIVSGLTPDQVLTLVSDDIVKGLKQANGTRGGRLVHALWQLLGELVADIQWIKDHPPKA